MTDSTDAAAAPTIGFVSLGCPKALTDSELILTRLQAEGYRTSKTYADADVVIVNTCGFIDAAVQESLDAIGDALDANGKVIVTGCLGARTGDDGGNLVRKMHPKVLAVTGPHATQEVMDAVHLHSPKPHDPFVDLVPAHFDKIGIKLTPKHYAYLKISEGCNHRCSFCIIPSMRGDLASRPIGDVMLEAERLVKAGVKELLVISQDTSAYGADLKYATGFWGGKPVKARFTDLVPPQGVRLTPKHYAYVKISEGCNHRCTFCIIPSMRGDLVSRPIGEVLAEARNLLKAGVREILVISQDTSAYGVDVRHRTGFVDGRPVKTHMTELVRELDRLARGHGAWVRLHYVYPYPHVDDVIELMADDVSAGGVVPYLDVPFQHASPRILKLMKRPAAPERVLERVRAWRKAKPDLAIRSTFITGFPGETETEFDELLAFLDEAKLDRVGCFAYSPVEGAAANALPGPVDPDVREARRARFMERQAAISAERLAAKVGRTLDVLVDSIESSGRSKSRHAVAIARTAGDAPEIDGVVRIENGGTLAPGSFARVTVVASDAHDLDARLAPA